MTAGAGILHKEYHEKEFSNLNFTNLLLLEENDDEYNILQNINIIIGKYLLSLFYYKDILLDEREFIIYLKYLYNYITKEIPV